MLLKKISNECAKHKYYEIVLPSNHDAIDDDSNYEDKSNSNNSLEVIEDKDLICNIINETDEEE